MRKLIRYSKTSSFLNLQIKYDDEVFKFNLYEELQVTEVKINSELKEQPSVYAFIAMLHKKLIKKAKDQKKQKDTVFAQRYIHYKTQKTTKYFQDNQKQPADDLCKAFVEADKLYIRECLRLHRVEEQRDDLEVCVLAFEQRKDLIQSLSANIRKEK